MSCHQDFSCPIISIHIHTERCYYRISIIDNWCCTGNPHSPLVKERTCNIGNGFFIHIYITVFQSHCINSAWREKILRIAGFAINKKMHFTINQCIYICKSDIRILCLNIMQQCLQFIVNGIINICCITVKHIKVFGVYCSSSSLHLG